MRRRCTNASVNPYSRQARRKNSAAAILPALIPRDPIDDVLTEIDIRRDRVPAGIAIERFPAQPNGPGDLPLSPLAVFGEVFERLVADFDDIHRAESLAEYVRGG